MIILFLCCISKGYSQCGSTYVVSDDTVICSPQIVKFKARSFPAGTTFEWNMGAGYVSSDSTFTYLFNNPGNYTISLRLTYTDGSKCTIIKNGFIQAKPVPTIKVNSSLSAICNFNDSVVLTDVSQYTYSRDWLVDNTLYKDGPPNIKVLYTYPSGYKDVTVFLKDSFGCKAKKTIDSIVYVADSVKLNFEVDKMKGCTPIFVNFTNNSDTLNNHIASWNWSFPGATPSSSLAYNPKNIRYTSTDSFDVLLKVTTTTGCSYSIRKNNHLTFADSIILTTTFSKTSMCGGEQLKLSLPNVRSPKPVVNISPSSYSFLKDSAKAKVIKFSTLGKYSFYISDEYNGCKSEKNLPNYITVNGPLAQFTFKDNRSCLTPDTFVGTSTTLGSVGISFGLKWNLYFDSIPNNSLQTGTSDTFRALGFAKAKYTVRLIANGSNGCKDTFIQPSAIIIDKIKPVFNWEPIPSCPGEMVNFINGTAQAASKYKNRYKWTFFSANNSVMKKDTLDNPKISYPDTGRYTVKLLAYNNLGCKDSVTYLKKIIIKRPDPKFTVSDSTICVNGTVKVKMTYDDTMYYRKYVHSWIIQHLDSASYNIRINADSVVLTKLWPGKYSITYITFSKLNTCYDTFKLKTTLYISGQRYKTTISAIKGCNPFTATVDAKKLMSYNFENSNPEKTTTYWSVSNGIDTNQVKFADRLKLTTSVLFKKAGGYYIGFSFYPSSGCNDSFSPFVVNSGVKAQFQSSVYGCVGKPYIIKNTSDADAVRFKWSVIDTANSHKFFPSDTSKNPILTFGRAGVLKVQLISYGNGLCSDTVIQSVIVNKIKADFTSNDTLNYCAPIITTFTAGVHPYIISYNWKFGNEPGIFTTGSSSISHLYKYNTGPNGSPVTLIVNAYGCSDTMVRNNFIKIIGPIPKFAITNNVGCEKLNVKYTNQSQYFKRFYLQYGDGSYLDSVNFYAHIYKIFDRTLPQQNFIPKLYLLDSFGCLAEYESPDTIKVFRAPIANYTIGEDTGCADFTVQFRNLSTGAASYRWDYEGDNTMDVFTPFPQRNYPAGDFSPILIARSMNGCDDTLKNKYAIKVYPTPNVTYTNDFDTVCYNGKVKFNANSLPSNSEIKQWKWDFGNPNSTKDTSLSQNPEFTFNNAGLNQVSLIVTDLHNCKDVHDKFIYVNDTIGPVSSPINFVTVQNSNDIVINWSKSAYQRFTAYNLYRDNSAKTLIYNTSDIKDTLRLINSGINVNNLSYCYTINTVDECNIKGAFAETHCTILLTATDSINKLVLNWLAYTGWNKGSQKGVSKYLIYRSENGGPFKIHDSTANTRYEDKKLCNKSYCYYVVALQKNGRWRSQSNTACKSPIFIKPSIPIETVVTTVLPSKAIYTTWRPYKFIKDIKTYHVSRYYNGGGYVVNYATTDSTGFIDRFPSVNTDLNAYEYHIRVEDNCGNFSPEGNVSKSILLSGTSENYVAKLNWNPYEKWFSGVKQYEVYLRTGNQFNILTQLPGNQLTFNYDFVDTKLDDSICFKVKAIKDTTVSVISYSNERCLIAQSQVWVPNVFTPNKDGNNEVFIPKAILIFNNTGNVILDYHMEIFNRWGEKVFDSQDVNVGWDGSYMGKPAPDGFYMYRIKALGLDGVSNFNLDGVITLLR